MNPVDVSQAFWSFIEHFVFVGFFKMFVLNLVSLILSVWLGLLLQTVTYFGELCVFTHNEKPPS